MQACRRSGVQACKKQMLVGNRKTELLVGRERGCFSFWLWGGVFALILVRDRFWGLFWPRTFPDSWNWMNHKTCQILFIEHQANPEECVLCDVQSNRLVSIQEPLTGPRQPATQVLLNRPVLPSNDRVPEQRGNQHLRPARRRDQVPHYSRFLRGSD